MFAFLAKSKQMKTIGRASAIPVLFGVNEPILFGAPVVLNPIFFIPFVTAPILNVWIFKFFVDTLGMDGFIYNLPWTTPGPIGLILGTGFAGLAVLLVILLLIVDFLIYFPFFKAYDNELVAKENLEEVKAEPIFTEEPPIAEQVTTGLMEEGGQKMYWFYVQMVQQVLCWLMQSKKVLKLELSILNLQQWLMGNTKI